MYMYVYIYNMYIINKYIHIYIHTGRHVNLPNSHALCKF